MPHFKCCLCSRRINSNQKKRRISQPALLPLFRDFVGPSAEEYNKDDLVCGRCSCKIRITRKRTRIPGNQRVLVSETQPDMVVASAIPVSCPLKSDQGLIESSSTDFSSSLHGSTPTPMSSQVSQNNLTPQPSHNQSLSSSKSPDSNLPSHYQILQIRNVKHGLRLHAICSRLSK